MKRKILNIIAVLALVIVSISMPLAVSAAAKEAAAPTPTTTCTSSNATKNNVLGGVGDVGGNNCDESGATGILKTATNVLSLVAGAVAVIMVVLSGFKYVTSSGDPNKVAAAKNTLIYALIGIAVAVLAQTMVHFVINRV